MKHLWMIGLLIGLVVSGCGRTDQVLTPTATVTVATLSPSVTATPLVGSLVTNPEIVTAETVACPEVTLPSGWSPRTEGALDARGLANLEAFARLYGYLRHWYPGDEAVNADWALLAWNGVAIAEDAPDTVTLAARLNALFCPIAPGMTVYIEGEQPPPLLLPPRASTSTAVTWNHEGIGAQFLSFGGVTTPDNVGMVNERRVYQIFNGRIPDDVHGPTEVWRAPLGNGIAVQFPLTLYQDSDGRTLPRSRTVPAVPLPLTTYVPTVEARLTRLGEMAMVWGIVQHFYAYKDVAPPEWDVALSEGLTSGAEAEDAVEYWYTLQRMSHYVYDGHANMPFAATIGQKIATLPIIMTAVEGEAVVEAVLTEGVNLKAGDVIVTWNGIPMAEQRAATAPLVSANTETFRAKSILNALAFGRVGERVEIVARQPSGAFITITLTYDIQPETWLSASEVVHESWPPIYEVAPGIFYVSVARMTDALLEEAVAQVQAGRGIILDYREYPGSATNRGVSNSDSIARLGLVSYLLVPLEIPRFPLPDQQQADRGSVREVNVNTVADPLNIPVVCLIDGRTISWAEHDPAQFATGGALLVGSPTAGSNGNAQTIQLPSGSRFSFTGQRAWQPDGTLFYGVGVLPTHPLEPTIAGIAAGRDELVEYAVTLLEAGSAP